MLDFVKGEPFNSGCDNDQILLMLSLISHQSFRFPKTTTLQGMFHVKHPLQSSSDCRGFHVANRHAQAAVIAATDVSREISIALAREGFVPLCIFFMECQARA
jgi:hypothetical protein